jgi:ribonuclease P protein component
MLGCAAAHGECPVRRTVMHRSLGVPRRLRLVRGADFARVFKTGARARGKLLVVAVCPNELPHVRLGLSVGRTTWKSAVRRNRVRRIFREAFRLSVPELPAGYDIVMIPGAPALRPGLAETRIELVALVARAAKQSSVRTGDRRGAGS